MSRKKKETDVQTNGTPDDATTAVAETPHPAVPPPPAEPPRPREAPAAGELPAQQRPHDLDRAGRLGPHLQEPAGGGVRAAVDDGAAVLQGRAGRLAEPGPAVLADPRPARAAVPATEGALVRA